MSRSGSERLPFVKVISHLGVMVAVAAVLGVVVAGLAVPFAAVVGVTTRNVADTMDQLPTELEADALPQKTRIVDGSGETIATIFDQNRVEVSLSQVSRKMVKAIVAIEDYRFYEHGALDVKGTIRALLTNSASSGVVQGGSSITQQMVKLTLLGQADTKAEREAAVDQTYQRKLRELRYAIAVEKAYSKDWILERYLNIAYFGDGAYGVQAAARHYFGVNARKLNLNQSAILAGLVQNPTKFDPTNSPDRARERRDIVLDRMAELNVVSEEQAEKVKAKGLQLGKIEKEQNGCFFSRAPFFCDYVLRYLLRDRSLGRTREERWRLLNSGGLTIRTTVDLRMQDEADEAVSSHVYPEARAIGALAMVEPGTGKVRALAQSRPMGPDRDAGETYLNYAVPEKYGTAKGFQGGSTFKAFTLAQAIEDGTPLDHTIFSPDPGTFQEESYEDCDGEPYGYGEFTVPNSTTGSINANLYNGTRLSVNTFFLGLEEETGICAPFKLAQEMGVDLENPTGKEQAGRLAERVPNFTLGVADVSPLEMAEAYATFAARGVHCDSRPVTAIEDAQGNVLKKYEPRCTRVLEESTADAVSDILRGVLEGSGFAAAQNLGRDAAGKTGTTNGGNSVWFVGYTPTMATAAMIAGADEFGNPDSLESVDIGPLTIYGASGSGYAAPIWGQAMRGSLAFYDAEAFNYPEGVEGVGVYAPAPPPPPPSSGGGRGGDGGGGGGGGGGGNGNGNGGGNGGGRGNGGR